MATRSSLIILISIVFVSAADLSASRKGFCHNNNCLGLESLSKRPSNLILLSDGKAVDVNDFLIGVIENFRDDMLTGVPELKVPILDPYKPKKPINLDIQDDKAEVKGNFTDIIVEGLSGFKLQSLNADMHNLSLHFELKIPYLKVNGSYVINGKLIKIIPLRGNGHFWVESKNLSLSAKASIINSEEDDHLQLSDDFDVLMDFDKVELYLENFLGGGQWAEILLKILNDMSKDLFRKSLPLIKGDLNKSLLNVINKSLKKLPITAIKPGSNADEYIDQILVNVQNIIQEKTLDPMKLPDFVSNFTKEVMSVTFRGEAKLYDGWISGISSIHRADKCEVDSNRTTISVAAHLGLRGLRLFYKGHAKFMSMGPSITAGGNVQKVAFYFHIEQSNKKGATPVLRRFEIVEMSTIWIELGGLGPLTWIMKWLLTGVSKLIENFIVNKMTNGIREFLETEFSKLSFPV